MKPRAPQRAGIRLRMMVAVASCAVAASFAFPLAFAGRAWAADPWLDRVRAFEPGDSAGFGADELPRIVLGPPEGLGKTKGSVDVVSLGNGGRIVVAFADNAVVDGEGDDLVVFENPFYGGALLFTELAFVEVSADGRQWTAFPYDANSGEGLAGREPVLANAGNGLDPLDEASGGDRFDLADVGLDYVRFVRITDAGELLDDPGNHSFAGTKGGFDLDAAAAIHSVDLGCIAGTVIASGQPVPGARVILRAAPQRRRHRITDTGGQYRFCRLRPGLDYDLGVSVEGAGSAEARVYLDEAQLRMTADLFLH